MAPQKVKAAKEETSEVILFSFWLLLECHYDSAFTKFQSADQSLNKTIKNRTKPKNESFDQAQPFVPHTTSKEIIGLPKSYKSPNKVWKF